MIGSLKELEISKNYKKIAILRGGISDECKISQLTADQVYKTLQNKFSLQIIEVTKNCKKLLEDIDKSKPDVIFNCLHGYFGEDGQIQSIMNYLEIPYTHSGVLTSSLCMNKILSKKFFISLGVACPENIDFSLSHKIKIQKPIIIKPICGGSSNGLYKINNGEELNSFFQKNKERLNFFMIEEYVEGREITVGILENKVCGIMEIKFKNEIYDFKNKYVDVAEHILNPNLPNSIIDELKDISLKIHKNLNCNCISRLDFRYSEEDKKLFLLEVNTQPGLTKNSLLPEMAYHQGVSFNELCNILISNSRCENFFFFQ